MVWNRENPKPGHDVAEYAPRMGKPDTLMFRVLRAFGVSACASFLSAIAGLAVFWAFASLLLFAYGGTLPFDGPYFSLVGFNVVPAAMVVGVVAFGAQLRPVPARAVDRVMRGLLYLLGAVLLACLAAVTFSEYGNSALLTEGLCFTFGAGLPCIFVAAIHWRLVRRINRYGVGPDTHGKIPLVLMLSLLPLALVFFGTMTSLPTVASVLPWYIRLMPSVVVGLAIGLVIWLIVRERGRRWEAEAKMP